MTDHRMIWEPITQTGTSQPTLSVAQEVEDEKDPLEGLPVGGTKVDTAVMPGGRLMPEMVVDA